MKDMLEILGYKEALDRLANELPGHFIVDGFDCYVTEIIVVNNNFRKLKIVCQFNSTYQTLCFIRLMNKKHFHFCIPGTMACGQAVCTRWRCFDLAGVPNYTYRIYCYISLKGLTEDVTDGENC